METLKCSNRCQKKMSKFFLPQKVYVTIVQSGIVYKCMAHKCTSVRRTSVQAYTATSYDRIESQSCHKNADNQYIEKENISYLILCFLLIEMNCEAFILIVKMSLAGL